MKALTKYAHGAGSVAMLDVPEPVCRSGQVKIAVRAAGICGTDIHILNGEYPSSPPVVLGHEIAGEVLEIGEGVGGFAIGNRVCVLPFAFTCGKCRYCVQGEPALCSSRLSFGSGVDGAFAPYLVASAGLLRPLPAQLSFEAGAVLEPLACCVKAVLELTTIRAGDVVLISGPGPMGLLSLQLAKAQGAKVILVGTASDVTRLEVGRAMGADWVVDIDRGGLTSLVKDVTDGEGVDIVLECAGVPAAVNEGVRQIRKQGQFTQLGLIGGPLDLEWDQAVLKDIRVVNSFSSNLRSWARALNLVESGLVKLAPLVSATLPLTEWEKGFAMTTGRLGLKIVLCPSDS